MFNKKKKPSFSDKEAARIENMAHNQHNPQLADTARAGLQQIRDHYAAKATPEPLSFEDHVKQKVKRRAAITGGVLGGAVVGGLAGPMGFGAGALYAGARTARYIGELQQQDQAAANAEHINKLMQPAEIAGLPTPTVTEDAAAPFHEATPAQAVISLATGQVKL